MRRAYLSEEPGDEVAKDDGLVGLVVAGGRGDTGDVPEVALPLVQVAVGSLGVEEQDAGSALDQPAAVHVANATVLHGLEGGGELGGVGLHLFHLDGSLEMWSVLWW